MTLSKTTPVVKPLPPVTPMASEFELAQIPQCLKNAPRWVNWQYELSQKGTPAKRPYKPFHSKGAATVTSEDSCGTYEQALERGAMKSRGLGFALFQKDGFVGIDLDFKLHQGEGYPDIVVQILEQFEGTYAEETVSGKGVRIWLRGSYDNMVFADKVTDIDGLGTDLEIYGKERYFTVSGRRISSSLEIEDMQDELDLLSHVMMTRDTKKRADYIPNWIPEPGDFPVSQLISVMRKESAELSFLLDGNHEAAGFVDASQADWSLGQKAAFYCGGDAGKMLALLQQSGAWRAKWDEKRRDGSWIQKLVDDVLKGWNGRSYSAKRNPEAAAVPSKTLMAKGKSAVVSTCGGVELPLFAEFLEQFPLAKNRNRLEISIQLERAFLRTMEYLHQQMGLGHCWLVSPDVWAVKTGGDTRMQVLLGIHAGELLRKMHALGLALGIVYEPVTRQKCILLPTNFLDLPFFKYTDANLGRQKLGNSQIKSKPTPPTVLSDRCQVVQQPKFESKRLILRALMEGPRKLADLIKSKIGGWKLLGINAKSLVEDGVCVKEARKPLALAPEMTPERLEAYLDTQLDTERRGRLALIVDAKVEHMQSVAKKAQLKLKEPIFPAQRRALERTVTWALGALGYWELKQGLLNIVDPKKYKTVSQILGRGLRMVA